MYKESVRNILNKSSGTFCYRLKCNEENICQVETEVCYRSILDETRDISKSIRKETIAF